MGMLLISTLQEKPVNVSLYCSHATELAFSATNTHKNLCLGTFLEPHGSVPGHLQQPCERNVDCRSCELPPRQKIPQVDCADCAGCRSTDMPDQLWKFVSNQTLQGEWNVKLNNLKSPRQIYMQQYHAARERNRCVIPSYVLQLSSTLSKIEHKLGT